MRKKTVTVDTVVPPVPPPMNILKLAMQTLLSKKIPVMEKNEDAPS
jgi:hypothetical protein